MRVESGQIWVVVRFREEASWFFNILVGFFIYGVRGSWVLDGFKVFFSFDIWIMIQDLGFSGCRFLDVGKDC